MKIGETSTILCQVLVYRINDDTGEIKKKVLEIKDFDNNGINIKNQRWKKLQ